MKKKIEILFQDDYVVVVNKPARMLVVPAPKKDRCLTSVLSEELKEKVYPCHRLDFDTSGAIIFAKSLADQKKVMEQFKEKRIFKRYIAFTHGVFQRSAVIKSVVKAIGKQGKEACTKFTRKEGTDAYSVVQAIPVTGRSNQIRIHCVQQGNPIIGDRKYSVSKEYDIKFKRTCLHAEMIEFFHPLTGDRINIKVPLADDMAELLRELKKKYQGA